MRLSGRDLITISSYQYGTFTILQKERVNDFRNPGGFQGGDNKRMVLALRDTRIVLEVPAVFLRNLNEFSVKIFSLNGKLLGNYRLTFNKQWIC